MKDEATVLTVKPVRSFPSNLRLNRHRPAEDTRSPRRRLALRKPLRALHRWTTGEHGERRMPTLPLAARTHG